MNKRDLDAILAQCEKALTGLEPGSRAAAKVRETAALAMIQASHQRGIAGDLPYLDYLSSRG